MGIEKTSATCGVMFFFPRQRRGNVAAQSKVLPQELTDPPVLSFVISCRKGIRSAFDDVPLMGASQALKLVPGSIRM